MKRTRFDRLRIARSFSKVERMNQTIFRAQKRVKDFQDVLTESQQSATDALDAEDWMQVGIDAFNWIMRADRKARLSIDVEERSSAWKVDAAVLETLCKAWLAVADRNADVIEKAKAAGHML